MIIDSLSIQSLDIPFQLAFSHAAAERSRTQSVLVKASSADGLAGYGESCPREYVTGESVDSVRSFFDDHRRVVSQLTDRESLLDRVVARRAEIDAAPAAWCAMEMALLDLLGKTTGKNLEALLEVPALRASFGYSAIIGTDNVQLFEKLLGMYLDQGFTDFKIKLLGDAQRDRDKVALLRQHSDKGLRIRFDANNCWPDVDTARRYLAGLDCPFWAVEEPLGQGDYPALARLAADLGCKIILDESFLRFDQLSRLDGMDTWVINIRVSKMGGLLRSLEIVEACRRMGIAVIVGAQVGETSLLTRAGLTVANAAGDILVAQEGAYGTHLLQHDICEPLLMFGRGGRLEIGSMAFPDRPGLGLDVHPPEPEN